MNEMEMLFKRWKEQINAEHFVEDGVICFENWNKAERKVLFILKETNDYKGNITKLINDAVTAKPKSALWKRPTFHNIGRWSYGLLNYQEDIPAYKIAHKNRKASLRSCAFINLKKTTGGRTATKAVEEHAIKYAPLIKEQILLLNPDVVVLGGTYEMVKKHVIPELSKVSPRVHKFENMIFINANHPACTKTRKSMYEQVLGSFDLFERS